MKTYPAVAAQELYAANGTSADHDQGSVHVFADSSGNPVWARWMKNDAGATLPAGGLVAHAGAFGEIGGAAATNTPYKMVAGAAAASMASNGFGWVIFRGQQTNASAATSSASSSADRNLALNGAAVKVTAATLASNAADHALVCGQLAAGDALAADATNTIYWNWR